MVLVSEILMAFNLDMSFFIDRFRLSQALFRNSVIGAMSFMLLGALISTRSSNAPCQAEVKFLNRPTFA
ncbi:hypothetical protein D3C71_2061310 [compost metagenome]